MNVFLEPTPSVRENAGNRPCIPPPLLAEICHRLDRRKLTLTWWQRQQRRRRIYVKSVQSLL